MGFFDRPPLAVPVDPRESSAVKHNAMRMYALAKALAGMMVLFVVWAAAVTWFFDSAGHPGIGGFVAIFGVVILLKAYSNWVLPVRY